MSRLVSIKSTQGRLILRSPETSDADNLLERLAMPSCVEFLPHLRDRVFTVEGLSKQIENWRSISMISGLFLVVELVSDGRVIGDGGFESVDFENRTGEIGINLNDEPDIRGKGYAVEALETMLDYSFKELGLKSVKLWTLKVNKPLRGLLEKRLGLTPDANTGDTESCYTVEAHSWLKNATNMQ